MSKHRHDLDRVRAVLQQVADQDPDRVDRRAETGSMACRYTEHGQVACLAAHVLHRLGFSYERLRTLDRAANGSPVELRSSGLGTNFTPDAFELLCKIQAKNDLGRAWGRIARELTDPDRR